MSEPAHDVENGIKITRSRGPDTHRVGLQVTYQTDGRNGVSYPLPALISCNSETHLRTLPDGTPIPLEVPEGGLVGKVHLTIFTPGPGGVYTELNVPYDAIGKPRSWRY